MTEKEVSESAENFRGDQLFDLLSVVYALGERNLRFGMEIPNWKKPS